MAMTADATRTDLKPTTAKRKRIQPLVAWRAIKALIADKEDTGQVFKIIQALEGNAPDTMFRRFAATATGRAVLGEKRNLLSTLSNTAELAKYPAGTLGHRYHQFMTVENLTADGLVEASEAAPRRKDRPEDNERFGNRMRDSHDLWHCTTGYGRDGLGELCLLAFTYAQTRNRGIGAIVFFGGMNASKAYPTVGVWAAVREGYRLGRKARWLPGADWENYLSYPLSELRAELKVGDLKVYRETLARVAAVDAANVKSSAPTSGFKLAA